MNVIHTVPAIANEASGPSYSVVRLCDSLIDAGAHITLATLDWAPIVAPPAYSRSFPLGLGPRRLGRSPSMSRWLELESRSGKVDVFHNHSLWMMPNVYPGRVAKKTQRPYVVSPRGTLSAWAKESGSHFKKLFFPLVQEPTLEAVTCFHATALSEYEDIRRLGFRQPVVILPNGVDVQPLVGKALGMQRTLLFLGRIHPVKGLDMLLPAWSAVQHRFPEWHLRIVGPDNDSYLDKIRSLATELRLQRVQFTGPLFGAEKLHAYSQAELFVLPSYSENFGMSVAEALAAGTPAIVTDSAPWSGLPQHYAGWQIATNLDSLIACLEIAMALPPATLAAMGLRGHLWMAKEFSWAAIGKQMADTYLWLLNNADMPACVVRD